MRTIVGERHTIGGRDLEWGRLPPIAVDIADAGRGVAPVGAGEGDAAAVVLDGEEAIDVRVVH